MSSDDTRPPPTISREEFLQDGSDTDFRRSIYALIQSVSRLLACRDAFSREMGLTPTQFAVLMGVAHCQGEHGVTIRELADHVGLAATHVTTEVGHLKRAGYLTKRASETDRRSVLVSLLPHGMKEITRASAFVRMVNDALFRGIDAADLGVTHHVCRQLILNSENALAEIRRHVLMAADAPAFSGKAAKSTSRAANTPPRAASRSGDRHAAGGSAPREKAAAARRPA